MVLSINGEVGVYLTFGDRSMVGQWFLVPFIWVRILVSEPTYPRENNISNFLFGEKRTSVGISVHFGILELAVRVNSDSVR